LSAVTGFKRLGYAVAALLIAIFGVLGIVSVLIPADQVREAIKAEIRAVTGLDPLLRGDITVSLFPYGKVSFTDVALGDFAQGAPPLAADRLTTKLRFFPLLAGKIEVADVALENPRITLVIGEDGRSNWLPLMATLNRAFSPDTSSRRLLSFSEIRITGGSVSIRDDVRNISERISDIDMSLAWPAISKSFAATGRVKWRDEPVDIHVTFGDFAATLRGERTGLKVRLAGTPMKFGFDGTMSTRPTLKVEGAMSADSTSLRRALAWSGQKTMPVGGFERFALKAQTSVVGGTIALTAANLEIDGNPAEGVLTFATDGRQTLQGTLASDSIDLTPYLATIRLLTDSEREWSRRPISLEGFSDFELDLRLSAAKITIGSAKLGRTAIATNLRSGKLTVTVGESRTFGGVIKGSLGLAAAPGGAEFKSQLQFTDIDLEPALSELFGVKRLEGKGDLAFVLEGTGHNVLALTRTLNGTATLTGRQGALTGLNLEQLMRRLERRPLSGGSEFRTGRTPFEKLAVTLKITDGTAQVESTTLEGGAVKLALAGHASIPSRDLDLKGIAKLVTAPVTDGRAPFELPFVVQGPWDDPLMLPDPEILIRRSGAAAPLLDAVRDRRAREAVRAAIERLTGGKLTTLPVPEGNFPDQAPPAAAPAPAPAAPALAGAPAEPPAPAPAEATATAPAPEKPAE
jgi:AsmA protein